VLREPAAQLGAPGRWGGQGLGAWFAATQLERFAVDQQRGAGVVVAPQGVAVVGEQLGADRVVAAVTGEGGLTEGEPELARLRIPTELAELICGGLGEAAAAR